MMRGGARRVRIGVRIPLRWRCRRQDFGLDFDDCLIRSPTAIQPALDRPAVDAMLASESGNIEFTLTLDKCATCGLACRAQFDDILGNIIEIGHETVPSVLWLDGAS